MNIRWFEIAGITVALVLVALWKAKDYGWL